jgi:type VI secretion system secreted protein Hcp
MKNLTTCEIKCWKPNIRVANGVGSEIQYYTIRLTNANIASINELVKKDASGVLQSYLKVAFTYQKIGLTWNNDGITAGDE